MNTERLEQRLRAKEKDLQSQTSRLETEARVPGERKVSDPADDATISQATSESLEEDALASRTLMQVQDALRGLESGSFGNCATCGLPIEVARLAAIPWAGYCRQHQELEDTATHLPNGGSTL